MKSNKLEYATLVLSEIFGEPVSLVRDQDADAYKVMFKPGYFSNKVEQAVDEVYERNTD